MEHRYIYRTNFGLEVTVIDPVAASDYLARDSSNGQLLYSLREYITEIVGEILASKFISVSWNLTGESQGYVEVVSTEWLDDCILGIVSRWIRDQCANKLGKEFKQQDFARYNVLGEPWIFNNDKEEAGYGAGWVEASFDWKTNHYDLKLVKVE